MPFEQAISRNGSPSCASAPIGQDIAANPSEDDRDQHLYPPELVELARERPEQIEGKPGHDVYGKTEPQNSLPEDPVAVGAASSRRVPESWCCDGGSRWAQPAT